MTAAPTRENRAELLALAFAMLFPTLGIWVYFVLLGEAGAGWVRLAYGTEKLVQFGFPLAWTLAVERAPLRFRRPGRGDLALGLATGLAAVAGLLAGHHRLLPGIPALAGAPAGIAARLASLGIETPLAFFLLAAFYSVVHSLLEEYYWRWFVYGRLRRRLKPLPALVLASAAFTAHHVVLIGLLLGSFGPATWLFSLAVAAAGAAWAWLYERNGSLHGPWLSHALVDAGLMWIGFRLWAGLAGA